MTSQDQATASTETDDTVHVHITAQSASEHTVRLSTVLRDTVVERSSLLKGIRESCGESSLPVAQSDVFSWLAIASKNEDTADLHSHSFISHGLPEWAASVISVRAPCTTSMCSPA
jgi:hypothetical protein